MADIAGLNMVEFDVIEGDYQDGGSFVSNYPTLPPENKYFGRVGMITDENFGVTQANYRKVEKIEIEVFESGEPPYVSRYNNLSAKKYSNRNGSQVIDFLRACGISQIPTSDEELIALVKSCSGRTCQFGLVWEAYDKDTETTTRGMDNFPPDPQNPSQRLRYVYSEADPTKKVYANGKVKYWVSAV